MLSLQSVIKSLPCLQKALENSECQLLQIIHEVCEDNWYDTNSTPRIPQMISDNRLALIADLITDNLNDAVGLNKVRITITWSSNRFADLAIIFRVALRLSMPEYMR